MKFLSKLLGGEFNELLGKTFNFIDDSTLSKEEKQEFKLKMEEYVLKLDETANETYQSALETRADIIKAELAQGDKFTKRARPAIIYTGLFFIFLVHVVLPFIQYLSGNLVSSQNLESIQLPEQFWWAWGTVVGVYGVGRTAEKFGMANKYTNALTGSKANQVDSKFKNPVG